MPKAKHKLFTRLTRPLYNLPYSRQHRPAAAPIPREPTVPSNPFPLVAFNDLVIGNFYNAAVTFKPNRAHRVVPQSMIKHRVLLTHIDHRRKAVYVNYVTTFGNGHYTPTRFHKNERDRQMYIPFDPLRFSGYLSVASTPPLMKGWLNFADPCVIDYNAGTSVRRMIRHTPESVGIAPPLRNGPIAIQDVQLGYVNAMHGGWKATVLSGRSIEIWKDKAEKLRVEYLAKWETVQVVEDVGSTIEDEEEWCGITCVSGSKLFFRYKAYFLHQLRGGNIPVGSDSDNDNDTDTDTDHDSEDSERSENCGSDVPSLHRASYVPEAASTPHRDPIVQCPTPVSMERPQQVIGPPTNLRSTSDEQWGTRLESVIRPEGYVTQSAGADRETPRYGTFTCEIVFWHIPAGAEDDFNDTTDAQWVQVMRGQTLPAL